MLTFFFIQNSLSFATSVNATCPTQLLRFSLQMSLATKNQSHGPIVKWPFSTSVLTLPLGRVVIVETPVRAYLHYPTINCNLIFQRLRVATMILINLTSKVTFTRCAMSHALIWPHI